MAASKSPSRDSEHSETVIIYDGECPFCRSYVHLLRLKDAVGPVTLLNAREEHEEVREAARLGLDLNEGMALRYRGNWHHGAECVHMLALLTSPNRIFNRITAWLFRSRTRALLLYPPLRFGRNLVLSLLGRSKLPRSHD